MEAYQWCVVVILIIVAIVGIPGNILVIVIYKRKARRLSMNVYISGLAMVDLFVCALSSYRLYFWIKETDFHDNTVCQLFTWIGFWSEMLTAFITTAIALDRYLSVCRPHAAIITPVRAMTSMCVFVIVSGLLSLVSFVIYGTDNDPLETVKECKIRKDGAILYTFATLTFTAYALLMLLALVFYWLVFREVRRRTKVEPRFIDVKPRGENTSSMRPDQPANVRSRSAPCTPTHKKRKREKQWEKPQQLMIAKQLEQRLTLVSLATAFPPGQSRPEQATRLDVETVSIRQSSFLTANIHQWSSGVRRSGSAVNLRTVVPDIAAPKDAASNSCPSSCTNDLGSNLGSQCVLNTHASQRDASDTNHPITVAAASGDANGAYQPAMRRRRTGKMLLLATIVFVGTWTARCIMWLVNFTYQEWWDGLRDKNKTAFAVLIILQHLYYTTPAVNPVIYSYVNPRFREDCAKTLKKIKCRNGNEL